MPAPSAERLLLNSPATWLMIGAGVATGAMVISHVIESFRHRTVAPGPRGLPLLGNLLDLRNTEDGPFAYLENMVRTYGEIIRLNMLGDEMLILNNPHDAVELLEKRSKKFSSRRPLIYSGKYQARNKRLVMLQYGPELRKQRAAFFSMLNPRSVAKFDNVMNLEASKLISQMTESPPAPTRTGSHSLHQQFMNYVAFTVLTLTYGPRLATEENLRAVMPILESVLQDAAPGAHLVDTFPFLDLLPDCLSSWRREANKKHTYESELYLRLAREVRDDMASGTLQECFASRLWEAHDSNRFDELTLAYVAGSAFEASIHTTSGTLMWLMMAMVKYPDAQVRAQAEIDQTLRAVNGITTEPPTLDMLSRLPYCVALIKETMRWMPVAPGAFPHASTEDETYRDIFIPKGTLVMPNIFAMHRDPRNFTEPDTFMPERFMGLEFDLDSNEVFTEGHWTFGFGRRICPARYLASKMVFVAAVQVLWAFKISPLLDQYGQPMDVNKFDCPWEPVNEPNPFPIQLHPRREVRPQAPQAE